MNFSCLYFSIFPKQLSKNNENFELYYIFIIFLILPLKFPDFKNLGKPGVGDFPKNSQASKNSTSDFKLNSAKIL